MTGEISQYHRKTQFPGECSVKCGQKFKVDDMIFMHKLDGKWIKCVKEECFANQLNSYTSTPDSQPKEPTVCGNLPQNALERTKEWNEKIVPMITAIVNNGADLNFWGDLYLQVYMGELKKNG